MSELEVVLINHVIRDLNTESETVKESDEE